MEKEIWKGKFNLGIRNTEVPIYIPLFIHRSEIWMDDGQAALNFQYPVPRLRFTTLGRYHPVCITPASVCNTQKEFSVRTSVEKLLQFRDSRENFLICPAPHDQ